jgi:hypothetical protein
MGARIQDAIFAYNHIVESEMLLWLISAADVRSTLVARARRAARAAHSMPGRSAAVRRVVPWSIVASALWK